MSFASTLTHAIYALLTGFAYLQHDAEYIVSSIRESRSDEKQISILTGTKRMHMSADTMNDWPAWIEALQVVQGMFTMMSNIVNNGSYKWQCCVNKKIKATIIGRRCN
ncbi:hypothetical protein E3N88_10603 [Mikania micrantha]|uniref:Uncharacterized protein n=1 Tax=Mikania micrantha TaxID=192012 RepID=A0A5N6LFY8_9ASTR|nr:hypothetical protein E3N88_43848 [Mikania micrantha]KAD6119332.1 hypothetical protein E3N88_10603 [Mikania micrantha]